MSARIIVVTSGKGGVGKTTLVANIGRGLASNGASVVIMDVDIGLNNLDVLTDIEHKVVWDIVDCIEGRCRVRQALVQDVVQPQMWILPSAHSYDKSKITAQNIKLVVSILAINYDFVLLDCPAGIELGFHRAISAASEALVVVTPHISSIRDAHKVIKLLDNYNLETTKIVINRARGDLIINNEMVGIDDIKTILNTPLVGVIPEDDSLNMLSNVGSYKKSQSGQLALSMLVDNIQYNTFNIFDVTKKYLGLLGNIRRKLKKNI